jgi:hypothetical protein
MMPDRASLESVFAELADDELLRRMGGGELTELARDVALAEARKRGIYLEALRESTDAAGVEVAHGHGPLCICARYLLPLDAQVLAARLQQEGLAARVMDSDTIYAVGAFMGGLARGGVRVMVPQSQLEQATRIRERYDAGEFAIDENFDPNVD